MSCFDPTYFWDKKELTAKLSELKDVKIHKETGVVSMKRGEIWHILTKCKFYYARKLVVDYEKLTISSICDADNNSVCLFTESGRSYVTTLSDDFVQIINNYYLGALDETTNSYVSFPPVIYQHKSDYYDSNLNKLATGKYVKIQLKNIQSFQHVHIIDDEYVLISRGDITKEYIETNLYLCADTQMMYDMATQTIIFVIKKYYVEPDNDPDDNVTFYGFIIPEYIDDMEVYHIDGVWLGLNEDDKYQLLTPRKPKSGSVTKPAL
jgi:hypothetical protein